MGFNNWHSDLISHIHSSTGWDPNQGRLYVLIVPFERSCGFEHCGLVCSLTAPCMHLFKDSNQHVHHGCIHCSCLKPCNSRLRVQCCACTQSLFHSWRSRRFCFYCTCTMLLINLTITVHSADSFILIVMPSSSSSVLFCCEACRLPVGHERLGPALRCHKLRQAYTSGSRRSAKAPPATFCQCWVL